MALKNRPGPSVLATLAALAAALAVLAAPVAHAEDLRIEKARRIRDEILAKRGAAGGQPGAHSTAPVNPWQAAVDAAREKLAAIDAEIESKRAHSESLAAPREKLSARHDELAAAAQRIEEQNRRRVDAICRGAKLGAGAAGWHPDPARSARLTRYLAAIATAQQKGLSGVEVEDGSVIAALDRARADAAAAEEELRALDADRVEAQAALDRASEDAANRPQHPVAAADEEAGAGRGEDAAEPAATGGDANARAGQAAATEGNARGDDFHWPAGEGAAARHDVPASGEAAADAGDDAAPELDDGPAVLAPSAPAGDAAAVAPPGEAPSPPKPRGFLARIFGDDSESDAFAASRGTLSPPVVGKVVANYGQQHKSGATYRGVILRATHGAPVRVVAAGKVSFAGVVPGLGMTVIVSHGSRYHTVYARLGELRVKEGDEVKSGVEVGELPDDNADMHFELRDHGNAIDPLPWLKPGIPGAPQP